MKFDNYGISYVINKLDYDGYSMPGIKTNIYEEFIDSLYEYKFPYHSTKEINVEILFHSERLIDIVIYRRNEYQYAIDIQCKDPYVNAIMPKTSYTLVRESDICDNDVKFILYVVELTMSLRKALYSRVIKMDPAEKLNGGS